MRARPGRNLLDKLENLALKAGIERLSFSGRFTAIKIHFGEPGNLAYIRPNYAARLVKFLLARKAKPFLTDAGTLYLGRRANGVDHLAAAFENGFNPLSVPCPVIIADGLKAIDYVETPLNLQYCRTAKIGAAIAEADIIISMNHFKGHEQAGFGGALKNLGMGSASRQGKLELHSSSQPVVKPEFCVSCGQCVKYCAFGAVRLNGQRKAEIDGGRCAGCGQCVAVCQHEAAQPVWDNSTEVMNCKVAEYTLAVLRDKPNFHLSFITDVSPNCDCWDCNDAAIVPDLGIAASFDPVALDMACADMVTRAGANPGTVLNTRRAGEMACVDKFTAIHPNTNWKAGLLHAQEIGVGSMEYELITV